MTGLVYYSSVSGNTARLVRSLGMNADRIPVRPAEPMPSPERPFVLICPTFADGAGRGAVPKQVIRFLNRPANRALLQGVIGAGNRNFGATFALSAKVIAAKCNVPVLYRFEMAGTEIDIARIREGLNKFWSAECSTMV
ncbi:class Ib ribonucleoside-diphosphate reductase assembly flavoprotein NrdI [Oceaniglobus ichthyenteri]|uniref:class Ib ribonucleoside-diphosphate reductase assembly flavoprotein NrdI n=1 Tax=Oceaniglobus ichthyenteri TaxID=2136177 RepID=UPI000D3592E6|nr:class Ib ribonucleoside-diphosphate reductase assembly flavoprotein NrdI [Oceaniglobus ichthyenteri]